MSYVYRSQCIKGGAPTVNTVNDFMIKTRAFARHWFRKPIASEQSAAIVLRLVASFMKRALLFSFAKCSFKPRNLFIYDKKQNLMILSRRNIECEIERCVSSTLPDWLIAFVTQTLVTG